MRGVRVAIIGGGIGGLSAALALRRAGFEPQVFEQADELLEVGAAIAVWPNAMRVLARLGVGAEVAARAGVLKRARWLGRDGRLFKGFELPETDAPALALHRADLQGALLRALPPHSIHLGKRLSGYEPGPGEVRAEFADGDSAACDVLVGADGLHSRVRAKLLGDGPPLYRGYTVWRGVTRLAHPALAPQTAMEFYGAGRRFGVGPVGLGRTGWWATLNEPEGAAELPSERRAQLSEAFAGWCAPVCELIEATPSEHVLRNAAYDRPPARRWGEGRVTLLGDAAHPVTPNLGQGGCLAIEDAAVLARCLAGGGDAVRALRRYESHRRVRTAYVAEYSRRYGVVGQWQSTAAVRLRDALLSAFPSALGRRLLRLIFDYDADAGKLNDG
jgi:2-polyprenyl-6-methoxyphenol hydroxylase-like FAD-dependent oxidoreductase